MLECEGKYGTLWLINDLNLSRQLCAIGQLIQLPMAWTLYCTHLIM